MIVAVLTIVALPYFHLCVEAGEKYDIDPVLLQSIMMVESSQRPDAVSPKGALGLMQMMPSTAKELGVDPLVPREAVHGAAKYLAKLRARNGDPMVYVAMYERGPYSGVKGPTPYSRKVMQQYWEFWRD